MTYLDRAWQEEEEGESFIYCVLLHSRGTAAAEMNEI
jgi:hypothetical protein